jgi:hypothetical protein
MCVSLSHCVFHASAFGASPQFRLVGMCGMEKQTQTDTQWEEKRRRGRKVEIYNKHIQVMSMAHSTSHPIPIGRPKQLSGISTSPLLSVTSYRASPPDLAISQHSPSSSRIHTQNNHTPRLSSSIGRITHHSLTRGLGTSSIIQTYQHSPYSPKSNRQAHNNRRNNQIETGTPHAVHRYVAASTSYRAPISSSLSSSPSTPSRLHSIPPACLTPSSRVHPTVESTAVATPTHDEWNMNIAQGGNSRSGSMAIQNIQPLPAIIRFYYFGQLLSSLHSALHWSTLPLFLLLFFHSVPLLCAGRATISVLMNAISHMIEYEGGSISQMERLENIVDASSCLIAAAISRV